MFFVFFPKPEQEQKYFFKNGQNCWLICSKIDRIPASSWDIKIYLLLYNSDFSKNISLLVPFMPLHGASHQPQEMIRDFKYTFLSYYFKESAGHCFKITLQGLVKFFKIKCNILIVMTKKESHPVLKALKPFSSLLCWKKICVLKLLVCI